MEGKFFKRHFLSYLVYTGDITYFRRIIHMINTEYRDIAQDIVQEGSPFIETAIRRFQVRVAERVKDLFDLKEEELAAILKPLNDKYKEIENSKAPAAGYEVHFKVVGRGKRLAEVFLDACETRDPNESMAMPQIPKTENDCAFCKNGDDMAGYEEAKTDSAHVIQSLDKNPLTISNLHAAHFFEANMQTQIGLLSSAIRAVQIHTKGESSRYTISSHCGTAGHQTFGHAHMHVSASFGSK
jgi:diadenosine tetraphosphate (Ap4A) HIT family hydrolase